MLREDPYVRQELEADLTVLGLPRGGKLTAEALTAAYQGKARKAHPDVPGGSKARMQRINEARQRLQRWMKRGCPSLEAAIPRERSAPSPTPRPRSIEEQAADAEAEADRMAAALRRKRMSPEELAQEAEAAADAAAASLRSKRKRAQEQAVPEQKSKSPEAQTREAEADFERAQADIMRKRKPLREEVPPQPSPAPVRPRPETPSPAPVKRSLHLESGGKIGKSIMFIGGGLLSVPILVVLASVDYGAVAAGGERLFIASLPTLVVWGVLLRVFVVARGKYQRDIAKQCPGCKEKGSLRKKADMHQYSDMHSHSHMAGFLWNRHQETTYTTQHNLSAFYHCVACGHEFQHNYKRFVANSASLEHPHGTIISAIRNVLQI